MAQMRKSVSPFCVHGPQKPSEFGFLQSAVIPANIDEHCAAHDARGDCSEFRDGDGSDCSQADATRTRLD